MISLFLLKYLSDARVDSFWHLLKNVVSHKTFLFRLFLWKPFWRSYVCKKRPFIFFWLESRKKIVCCWNRKKCMSETPTTDVPFKHRSIIEHVPCNHLWRLRKKLMSLSATVCMFQEKKILSLAERKTYHQNSQYPWFVQWVYCMMWSSSVGVRHQWLMYPTNTPTPRGVCAFAWKQNESKALLPVVFSLLFESVTRMGCW